MPFPFYLAMTAAEFEANRSVSAAVAWMACHFSPYGTGLSNFPRELPPGSMLILNDRTPVCAHDPELIAAQLWKSARELQCSRILLDLQRPAEALTARIVEAVTAAPPCPVGVSELYAQGLDCPVFLPPPPLHIPLSRYIAPWQGRKIWLEATLSAQVFSVTESGSRYVFPAETNETNYPHREETLHCRYRIHTCPEAITFTLHRSREDLEAMVRSVPEIECCVGLFQELG